MAERDAEAEAGTEPRPTRSVEDAPPTTETRREAQGRARRPARRDRRGPRDQRRGLREVLRAEGRPVAAASRGGPPPVTGSLRPPCRCRSSRRATIPAPSFAELLRRVGLDRPCPTADGRRRPVRSPTPPRASRVRYADGVVMAGDRRATAGNLISHRTMEKVVPGRPLQRRRHRRRGRAGHGDGQAVPAPARALREGRGHGAQPGGQGQPALGDGARQPARGHAGPGRRAALRRLRPAPRRTGRLFELRRHRRPLRGAATTSPPARAACTPARSSSSATATGLSRDDAVDLVRQGAVGGGRRGLGHRRARPAAGHLPGRGHHHRRGLRAGPDDELRDPLRGAWRRSCSREPARPRSSRRRGA